MALKYKKTRWGLLFFLVIFILIELHLRLYWGFCDAVLMNEDPDYEYIAAPHQERFRFRNHIKYNSYSMRNNEVDSSAYIILGFGDSVINGGTLTDHDSLATTILSKKLSIHFNQKVQFLNISAGSWGPDNCYAYLKKHGDFEANKIILFVSSHDAYDTMNFEKIVGVNKSFPQKQYLLAWNELISRYIMPRFFLQGDQNDESPGINKNQPENHFNEGFQDLLRFSKKNNIPFSIYLHAEKKELQRGEYNIYGKKIIDFAKENEIPLIKDLKEGLEENEYRDMIHLNNYGQKKMAERVFQFLKEKQKTP